VTPPPVDRSYLDAGKPLDDRVDCLVSQMTLGEKVSQMVHDAPAIERLGVPAYNWWNECLHGVARAGKATVFPQAIGMAATFNEPLLHQVATAIADEARAKHHQAVRLGNRGEYLGLTYWTPNINIFRDPRWGRGQETYGEDPHLTARLGVAFCKGLQGDHPTYLKLVATPKHFAVHSGPELLRHEFDARVSQRDLHETYLPAFQACVQEAGAYSVMAAYNRTNGEPCCASETLLLTTLRDQWGFQGYVVSDCWAIRDFHERHGMTRNAAESAALAVRGGCDLNCGCTYAALTAAVAEGLVSEEEIDICVRRLFTARFKLGMFDPEEDVPYSKVPLDVVGSRQHRALALRTARESIVLLKNNGLLPLARNLRRLVVVGPNAQNPAALLANYNGFSSNLVTPMEGILEKLSAAVRVDCHRGCDLWHDEPIAEEKLNWLLSEETDAIVAVLGYTAELEGEEGDTAVSDGGGDRLRIDLPGRQQELLQHLCSAGKPVVLVVFGGSPVDLSWAQQHVDAILFAWYPGEQGGHAIADVLFGDYNPAGRLPVTFVNSIDQLPPFEDYSMQGRTYRFLQQAPLYRFGYGLSYTEFAYSELALSAEGIDPEGSVEVSVTVANVGPHTGDEVVQLYVSDVDATVPVPRHHLEGFQRVHLEAGESRRMTFSLDSRNLACYGDDGRPFVEPGEFVISIGGGQPDDPAGTTVKTTLTVTDARPV